MAEEERTGLRYMINQTIERLQKSSVGANNMGTRYSRLLQLLWRKAPKKNGTNTNKSPCLEHGLPKPFEINSPRFGIPTTQPSPFENTTYGTNVPIPNLGENDFTGGPTPTGTFSWLDLGATWSFATQNNTSVGSGSAGDFDMDDQMVGDNRSNSFDMGLFTDYRLLNEDNPNLIF